MGWSLRIVWKKSFLVVQSWTTAVKDSGLYLGLLLPSARKKAEATRHKTHSDVEKHMAVCADLAPSLSSLPPLPLRLRWVILTPNRLLSHSPHHTGALLRASRGLVREGPPSLGLH